MTLFRSTFPELKHLDEAQRKSALQYGFGKVSARPVNILVYLAYCICGGLSGVVGNALFPGLIGWFIGMTAGIVFGAIIFDRFLHRVMKPHVHQYLAGEGSS